MVEIKIEETKNVSTHALLAEFREHLLNAQVVMEQLADEGVVILSANIELKPVTSKYGISALVNAGEINGDVIKRELSSDGGDMIVTTLYGGIEFRSYKHITVEGK